MIAPLDTDDLVGVSALLAQLGADAIAAEVAAARGRGSAVETSTKSSPADFVTAADLASEQAILAGLTRMRPDDGVLAEESGAGQAGTSGLRWLVDPLDGTMNFVHGRADHAVSVGVERVDDAEAVPGQQAVAGAVLVPATGAVYAAAADGSAVRSPVHLATSGAADLGSALVGVGYPRGVEARGRAHAWLGDLLPRVRDFRRMGSAACDLVAIATGALDVYIAFGVQPWDVGAGFALVRAAGGRAGWISSRSGRSVAVASPAGLYGQVEELVVSSDF